MGRGAWGWSEGVFRIGGHICKVDGWVKVFCFQVCGWGRYGVAVLMSGVRMWNVAIVDWGVGLVGSVGVVLVCSRMWFRVYTVWG